MGKRGKGEGENLLIQTSDFILSPSLFTAQEQTVQLEFGKLTKLFFLNLGIYLAKSYIIMLSIVVEN